MDPIALLIIIAVSIWAAMRWLVPADGDTAPWPDGPVRLDEPAPEVAHDPSSDIASVYDLTQPAEPFERMQYPRELLQLEQFQHGVAHLTDGPYSTDDLVALAGDQDVFLGCMALEALNRRGDADGAERILQRLEELYLWPLIYAIQLVGAQIQEPVVGRVLIKVREWSENRILLNALNEFVEQRAAAGETPGFHGALDGLPTEALFVVEKLLRSVRADLARPFQDELDAWRDTHLDASFLEGVGRLWRAPAEADRVIHHERLREQLAAVEAALLQAPGRSVVLVGETGVGKTALVRALHAQLHERGWTLFEASASDVLAGQIFIGGLEQRVRDLVTRIGGDRRVIWYLPSLQEAVFAGRHHYSQTSLLDIVLPAIERGEIRVVAEARPAAHERVLQSRPQVRTAFQAVQLTPLDDEQTLSVAREWARRTGDDEPFLDESTLQEAFALARQHLGSSAAPGNLLGLLKMARRRTAAAHPGLPLTGEALYETLSSLTGLPLSVLDDRQSLDVEALRGLFHERVIGQPEAVECLVERIAMVKAGLTDPSRPAGVLLFAGPTGTGKTEIAKTLAEFLFGSPDRMLRLDMSEFQTPDSLERLIGGASDTSQTTSLTNSIRKQPFAVVLLDEFEKAHPQVWDLFLQVFDDGRLTDREGNTADFRHAIIIMTSNLGAGQSEASIGFGAGGRAFSERAVRRAVEDTFRREFINRIDRIVVFEPLSRSVMREILRKELQQVLQRRGLRTREWAVEWEYSAISFLLEKGFTEDLGARPLKRAIEQYLLAPLGLAIATHQFPEGDQFLFVRSDGEALQVEFVDPDHPDPAPPPAEDEPGDSAGLVLQAVVLEARGLPEEVSLLEHEYETLEDHIGSDAWQARKQAAMDRMREESFWSSTDRFGVLGTIEYMDRIEAGFETAQSVMGRLSGRRPEGGPPRHLIERLAQQLYLVGAACRGLEAGLPRDAFVLVEAGTDTPALAGLTHGFAERLGDMYRRWARKRRMRLDVLEEERVGTYRLLMAISGFGAFPLLRDEAGVHVFEIPQNGKSFRRCTVRVRIAPQPDAPAHGSDDLRRSAEEAFAAAGPGELAIVRRYREEPSPLVRDSVRQWRSGRLDTVLAGDFDLMH